MNKEKTGFEDARITEMFGEWKETIKDIEKTLHDDSFSTSKWKESDLAERVKYIKKMLLST